MSASLRFTQVLARYGLAVALVLVVGGVAALGGAYVTYTDRPVEQVTEQTNRQRVSASVDTSGIVTNETALYEEGTRLRNMPVYFFATTPNLTFHVRATVPSDQRVRVTQRLTLLMRATRAGQEFFSDRRLLVAGQSRTSDGTAWANTTVNMSEVRSLVDERRAAIGGVGTLEVTLRLNVSYRTNRYSGRLAATAPVVITERAYWIDSQLADTRTHSTPVTRRVVRSPNMTVVGGLAAMGIASLVAAAFVLVQYRRIDTRSVETQFSRSRYDEWISNGEIPTRSEKEYIRTDSLEDLVDIAIDSNKRVIYDDSLNAYGVVEGDLVYYFTTDDEEITDWFDV